MREALFHKKNKAIFLFVSKNTAEWVYCPSLLIAKEKIKKTGIEQKLKTI